MQDRFFVAANAGWLNRPQAARRRSQRLCSIGRDSGPLAAGCNLLVKFRTVSGLVADAGRIEQVGGEFFVRSERLVQWCSEQSENTICLFFFEGSPEEARCVVTGWNDSQLFEVEDEQRLQSYGLPPVDTTVVDAPSLVELFHESLSDEDPSLFAVHADRFLESPSILVALFSHLMSIRTEDNIKFPIQVKKIAEQLRAILDGRSQEPRIERVDHSHLDLWAEVEGKQFSFLDGGAARIGAIRSLSPMALRVGIYTVRPGIEGQQRETWMMKPYVVADILDKQRRPQERPNPRRLQEAARYTLEAITGAQHVRNSPDTSALLMHGPLINQFAEYDEGEPNYLPFLSPDFLAKVGITQNDVEERLTALPSDGGSSLWNQFMAIYGYVMMLVNEAPVPIAGVVERPTGRSVATALLAELQDQGAFTAAYTHRVSEILEEYDITDDFLFGCLLRQGEFLTPVRVQKNRPHKARPRWTATVRQYPDPSSLLIKSEESHFPIRVELNQAARRSAHFMARFLYHTARLMPRYAFPVGLDIADRYAKIPDWLSRGVSAELSAAVLNQAIRTGDAHLVAQLRLFLARGPRDFFFRPTVEP